MKRSILFFSMWVLCLCAVSAQSTNSASGTCSGDIEWNFDGRTLILSSVDPKKHIVKIPDYDLNKNIAPWIKQKLAIRKVVIGAGITRVGSCAFANCAELATVEFQSSFVTEIGWGAFLNCRNLFNMSIPVNVKRIGTIAFANCSSLRSVTIPGLARVEDQAFMSCSNLSLIEVGDNAMLGKAVFVTEVKENGKTTHTNYKGEIRSLPRNINTDNCEEYGLDRDAVAICLKKSEPYTTTQRMSHVDANIPESLIVRNDTYALVIGNEHYRFVADVPYAQNDAAIFAEYCKKTLGVPAENIHLCKDATKHMILEQELSTTAILRGSSSIMQVMVCPISRMATRHTCCPPMCMALSHN